MNDREEFTFWLSKPRFTRGFADNENPGQIAGVVLERDLNLYTTEYRVENSIFEILALVGGLAVLTFLFFYSLDYCWTITNFRDYLSSELYFVDSTDSSAAMKFFSEARKLQL